MFAVLPVRTPTIPPATHTNCYRVGDTVIDPASPYPDEIARLAKWAGPIRRILLTHHHHDHVGGVVALAASTGATVWAHPDSRLPFPIDVAVHDGDRIDTGEGVLVAWHTPGHADGHLVFQLEGTGEVIAGDLVAGEGTIVLAPPEGKLADYLESLARIGAFASRLWPAHGPAMPASLTQDYIRHRTLRTQQFLAMLAENGPSSPEQIAAAVYAGVPGADLTLAALQVRAHLAFLEAAGRVRALDADRWSV